MQAFSLSLSLIFFRLLSQQLTFVHPRRFRGSKKHREGWAKDDSKRHFSFKIATKVFFINWKTQFGLSLLQGQNYNSMNMMPSLKCFSFVRLCLSLRPAAAKESESETLDSRKERKGSKERKKARKIAKLVWTLEAESGGCEEASPAKVLRTS